MLTGPDFPLTACKASPPSWDVRLSSSSSGAAYALAVGVVAAAWLVRWLLMPLWAGQLPYLTFFPAVMAAAWYGGLGPGLLATILSSSATFFVEPLGRFGIASGEGMLGLVLFVAVNTFISLLNEQVFRERARAEQSHVELRQSEELFRLMADAAPVLIWIAGPDRDLTYFNRPWLEFTGRTFEQEAGKGWKDGIHPEDRDAFLVVYRTAFAAHRPFTTEYRLRRHDGEFRWVLENGAPRFDTGGRFLGYIGSVVDITARKRVESQNEVLLGVAERARAEAEDARARAEELRAKAEAANAAKDVFLATVSHELRTPLSPILSWTQMLRRDDLDAERLKRAADVIARCVRTQAQLIEDLLDVSRIVVGKMRLEVAPVRLDAVIQRAIEVVRPAADAKDVRLQVVLDTEVGAVAGDADRLQQVVWNLLSNAIRFTPKRGHVLIALERVNSHVEIAVRDTGEGMDADVLPHIFERFSQADPSTTRVHGGLGLGLAIVRHIVEAHGGTVHAESAGRDMGSVFTVKLPLMTTRTADEPRRRHPTVTADAATGEPPRLDGMNVLLVDDEVDANEVVAELLASCGATVRVAGSVAHARDVLAGWSPDLVVSDVGMPDEDGYVMLAALRETGDGQHAIPAIALTAYASRDDRIRLLNAGFHAHLAKPVDPIELVTVIARVAGERARARAD
jgi:PAS domain S-box-containing protein